MGAAEWYRKNLRARAEGLDMLEALPLGTGRLPADVSHSSMRHVLDEVFAESPRRGSMTRGDIRLPQVCQETSEEVEDVSAKSNSICSMLSACFRLKSHSAAK